MPSYSPRVEFAAHALVALVAYLLGSIPTGYLVAKVRGVDIRKHGSGNIGATNVFRILGKPAGIFVLLADASKGWLAVCVAAPWVLSRWLAADAGAANVNTAALVAGFCAILGHNYTCWLNFKGGKGVATTAGVLLAWTPGGFGIALGIWIVVFALSGYVSLASIVGAASLPFATGFMGRPVSFIVVTAVLGVLAIYKHRDNIKRLRNGTENRFGKKKQNAEKTT